MTLTAEERSKLVAELDQLTAARTEILTGSKVRRVGFAGRTVEYGEAGAANLGRLEIRIREIEMKLGRRTASRARQVQF